MATQRLNDPMGGHTDLSPRSFLEGYGKSTMTRRSKSLMSLYPEPWVEIHPDDASRLGIAEGDKVKIVSRRGEFVARAWLTDRVALGLVFGTFHFPEGNANWATGAFLDPVAKIPEYKVSAVRVERLES